MKNNSTVKIYTSPSCHWCHAAKEYFKSKGVAYEEIDVYANPDKGQEMIEKSGQMGVPVIEINGKILIGFDREKIDEFLAIPKS